ncbi:MAG: hypothetical protein Q9203_003139 [Teloschistes exilis]
MACKTASPQNAPMKDQIATTWAGFFGGVVRYPNQRLTHGGSLDNLLLIIRQLHLAHACPADLVQPSHQSPNLEARGVEGDVVVNANDNIPVE